MATCTDEILNDLLVDCDNPAVAGIEQRAVWINRNDLENFTRDITNPKELITDITLKAGKTGYAIEGVKNVMNYTSNAEVPEDALNGEINTYTFRIYDESVDATAQYNAILAGAEGIIVIEKKGKGLNNQTAFRVLGTTHGLQLSEKTEASNENDGTKVVTVSTPTGLKEPTATPIYLDTDYATSKTAFDNKFATP